MASGAKDAPRSPGIVVAPPGTTRPLRRRAAGCRATSSAAYRGSVGPSRLLLPRRDRSAKAGPRGAMPGAIIGVDQTASNATDVSRDLGRSRGSPVTSRSRSTRLTWTASQSGAHQEAPFGIYIPGSRREIAGSSARFVSRLDSAPAALAAPDHADQRVVALRCASICAVSAATCALAKRSEALACYNRLLFRIQSRKLNSGWSLGSSIRTVGN
jgi:hypothetical protein